MNVVFTLGARTGNPSPPSPPKTNELFRVINQKASRLSLKSWVVLGKWILV